MTVPVTRGSLLVSVHVRIQPRFCLVPSAATVSVPSYTAQASVPATIVAGP